MGEVVGEGGELLFNLGAGKGLAVSGSEDAGMKERETANRESRIVLVEGEVSRRAVEFGWLRDRGVEERFGFGGAEGIADDEGAV